MVRVDKETLFYPLNTNTEKIKVLFIYLKPPSRKILLKRSLPTYLFFFFIQDIYYYNYKELLKKKIITKF